jgi:DNA-binding HxlR family transcriptional regulator
MSNTDSLYLGCPVQHARQFIAGKWQMGILWNLRTGPLSFGEVKAKLPGLSDKILMQELNFFVEKAILHRNAVEFPFPKTEYTLSPVGQSLIPVIKTIMEWGYYHLQNEQVSREMNMTPISAIEEIQNSMDEAG